MKRQKIYGAYFLAILFLVATTGFQVIHHYCGSCEHTSILPAPVPHLTHDAEHHHHDDKPCCNTETHQQHASCDVDIVKVEKPFVNNNDQQEDQPAILSGLIFLNPPSPQKTTSDVNRLNKRLVSPIIYLHCQLLI